MDRFSQIVATALLVDHALIDATRGDIIGTSGFNVGKPLIVSQVQVGLMAVNRDIALSVLIRVKGARVDIDVGIKLLARHSIAAREQQSCYARSDDAFTQRRDHAASNKDVSCFHFFFHDFKLTDKDTSFFPIITGENPEN